MKVRCSQSHIGPRPTSRAGAQLLAQEDAIRSQLRKTYEANGHSRRYLAAYVAGRQRKTIITETETEADFYLLGNFDRLFGRDAWSPLSGAY